MPTPTPTPSPVLSGHDMRVLLARQHKGLFHWSTKEWEELGEPKLLLPHVKLNNATLSLEAVECMDVNPTGKYVITGCADGNARIWRFDESEEALEAAAVEAMKRVDTGMRSRGASLRQRGGAGQGSQLDILKSELNPTDFKDFATTKAHLVTILEGHLHKVTCVRFSPSGDKVLTASEEDGTIRIWSFNGSFKNKEVQVIRVVGEDDEGGPLQPQRGPRRPQRVKSPQVNVYTACWSCDDLMVLALVGSKGAFSKRVFILVRLIGEK